jgi:hypothetical protein
MSRLDLKGLISESHCCVDCGFNTAPGVLNRAEAEQEAARQIAAGINDWSLPMQFNCQQEIYMVHDHVWRKAGMKLGYSGCLCIGCLERRIGRPLRPEDFTDHPFNEAPGTDRLLERRGHFRDVLGDFPAELEGAC